jgi:hypothetical protein
MASPAIELRIALAEITAAITDIEETVACLSIRKKDLEHRAASLKTIIRESQA